MNLEFLNNPLKANFRALAEELMGCYGIHKIDSRTGNDVWYRFAEIEFYLYDKNEPDKEVDTYNRDCSHVEWTFHASGVDISFPTVCNGDELVRFGGILIRSIEIFTQGNSEKWDISGVICGPRNSREEIFNHCQSWPDVIALPDGIEGVAKESIDATQRVQIKDDSLYRYVNKNCDWKIKTKKIVERKDKDKWKVFKTKVSANYNPILGKPQNNIPKSDATKPNK